MNTQDKTTTTDSRTVASWKDTVYWKGVRIGQCEHCKRHGKDVLRNGLCWVCDSYNLPVNQRA